MEFIVNLAQTISRHVRINLRRGDGRMPEQFLNNPQVSAVFEQVRGKTVPEHVWRHIS